MKTVDSDRYSPRLRHLSLQRCATTGVEPGHFLQRASTLLEEGIRCLLFLGYVEGKKKIAGSETWLTTSILTVKFTTNRKRKRKNALGRFGC